MASSGSRWGTGWREAQLQILREDMDRLEDRIREMASSDTIPSADITGLNIGK